MRMMLLAAAGVSLALSGAASAQEKQKVPQIEAPSPIQVPLGKRPDLDTITGSSTARAAGCIKHQLYNIQGLSRIATMFVLNTSSGDMRFNVEADAIRYLPPGAPVPIATTGETNRWDRVLTTLERAAAADKPLLVDYNMPGRDVFGIYIQWEGNCAP